MTAREFDPLRLDVLACAKAAAQLEGQWPLKAMDRLAAMAHSQSPPGTADVVAWTARAEQRSVPGGEAQPWLHLQATVSLTLECQRCLQPVSLAVRVDRSFVFVRGEAAASELDAQLEEDVLALPKFLDLRELVEDELLLTLPVVPRHEQCPQPPPTRSDDWRRWPPRSSTTSPACGTGSPRSARTRWWAWRR
jgi:uncharacterized protein